MTGATARGQGPREEGKGKENSSNDAETVSADDSKAWRVRDGVYQVA